jgi:UTP:GlnB (protein PII) uridylyltransferase
LKKLHEHRQPYGYWSDETVCGVYDFTLFAHNGPGLLTKICGALTCRGLSILQLQLFERTDDARILVFRLTPVDDEHGFGRQKPQSQVLPLIQRAILLNDTRQLDRQVRRFVASNKTPIVVDTTPHLNIYRDTAQNKIAVEMKTTNRVGLLYELCSIFFTNDFDILCAGVRTDNECAFDTFTIRPLSSKSSFVNVRKALNDVVVH